MTPEEQHELAMLVDGKREPRNSMEKHFIQVLAGESRPCTPLEKEWFSWAKLNKLSVPTELAKSKSSDTIKKPSTASTEEAAQNDEALTSFARLCIDCMKSIPEQRLAIAPKSIRCVKCQYEFEKTHDTRPKIDEGLAGSREENKRMRAQVWGEIKKRNTGS